MIGPGDYVDEDIEPVTTPVPGDREALARVLAENLALFQVPADDDELDFVVIDGPFNLLDVADKILARWRLVPVAE